MNTIIYYANFLDKKGKDRLMDLFPPVHEHIYYDHSTIMFRPKNLSLIQPGTKRTLYAWGRLTTSKVDLLLVDDDSSFNKFPHITLSVAEGYSPSVSNREIEDYFHKIERFKSYELPIQTVEGYFDGRRIRRAEAPLLVS